CPGAPRALPSFPTRRSPIYAARRSKRQAATRCRKARRRGRRCSAPSSARPTPARCSRTRRSTSASRRSTACHATTTEAVMADGWLIACDIRSELGEGPLWSARENAVYWVDILGHELHRLSLADSSVCSWKMPAKIGWVIERRDAPGFIAGLQTGFHALTLEPFECRLLVDPEPELPDNRTNDAKADSRGRIWAGTMGCE